MMKKIALLMLALFTISIACLAQSKTDDEIIVYSNGGKRVHVVGCRRLTQDPDELAKMTKMTLAEAKKKGFSPCSKCPVKKSVSENSSPVLSDQKSGFPGNTPVYYSGGKRGHVEGCPRLSAEAKAAGPNTTLAEMEAKGGQLCSRCPGSELNKEREASTDKKAGNKETEEEDSQGEKAKEKRSESPAVEYNPDTKVYCDALWMRVHAENCPELILKEKKKTMTLEEADKAGYRIGESGQSGRENCCLQGYRRKYPEKKIPEDATGIVQVLKSGVLKWHLAGCHRFTPSSDHRRMTLKEAKDAGCLICPHCIERGPSLTTISDQELKKLPSGKGFVPPEGWEPKPYSLDKLPPKDDLEILIQETLSQHNGIQECQFEDPVATAEHFMIMRFFFPVHQWLILYKAYRATGDKRILDKLRESARHYSKLSVEYPSAVQLKASDPEGMPFMYSMAAYARITLQLAKKYPDKVSQKEIDEAETFLKTIVSVLKPTCEGNDNLDPEMGIPKKLADDFRTRAFNRAMNGIGTISMATAALEDLQALKKTKEYQTTIDRYRRIIKEYLKFWFSVGHFCDKIPGGKMFVYPYGVEQKPSKVVDGCKIYQRAEDGGHYSHTLQGLMCLYESTPEFGVDDDFMTAVANAVQYCRTHKIKKGKKEEWSDHIQCPTALRVSPIGGEKVKSHAFRKGPGSERFYMLEAFRDGVIDSLFMTAGENQKAEAGKEYERRLTTLHVQYMKALRQDRSLIHLGEKK